MLKRLLLSCAAGALFASSSVADIQWSWAFGSEAGYFITDGNLVGGVAPPAQYNVLDFAVTQSFDPGNIGSISGGELDEGSQPGTGFTWDGSADTEWFRAGGFYTNGANYYSNVTIQRYLFFPGFYVVFDSNDNQLIQASTLTLTPGGASTGAYCFGDGTATACPCGNAGGANEGCANSSGAGAGLASTGSSSVAADDLGFASSQLLPNQPALLFTGHNAVNSANGNLFGDGLRCAGGSVVRLGVMVPNANGEASWGGGLAAAGGWTSGDSRYFQVWYRDPVGGPCGSGFNLSNGVEISFQP